MRWRAIALISLVINLALAVAWLASCRRDETRRAAAVTAPGNAPAAHNPTNWVIRRQPWSWRDIESADYATYAANLRDIGCPEQTIRDIIIADVNGLYARKRATELLTAEQQWWRSEPDPAVVRAAALKAQELEDQRRALLTRLLGTNWEAGDLVSLPRPSRPGVVLDGPVLGALPAETKLAIQEVNLRSQDRLQAYLEEQRAAGEEPDPVELARLRQQTRDELARLLGPPALEEYLLRYSQNANDLRAGFAQLAYFDPTPEEFRALFRATDSLDQRIQMLAGATDTGSVATRKALEEQRESAVKVALGPKRYEEYRLLHDPLYRDAVAAAEEAGTPEAARRIYLVNLAALAEQNRIRGDTNLSAEQRSQQLKQLELEQLQAAIAATGVEPLVEPPAPPPPPQPKKVYVLGPGDSATTIALMYGLPVSALKAANPKVDFNRLKPGVEITIPPSPFTAPSPP